MMKGLKKYAAPPALNARSQVVIAEIPCACATARRAARALTQLYDRHLHASGVEATQFSLLAVLGSGASFSQAALGQRFGLDKTTLSRNLRLLKNKGWIKLTPVADGRERRYILTTTGRNRLGDARPRWLRAQAELRSVLSEREWDQMWTAFRLVTVAAQTAQGATLSTTRRRRRSH